MYNIAIPKVIGVPTHDSEKLLADIRRCGANRVFLALPALECGSDNQEKIYGELRNEIEFFRDKNVEIGVWFWAFWVNGNKPFTPIRGFGGKESSVECCPADPAFLEFAVGNIKRIAEMSPDIIMFDDDLRFGFIDSGYGCVCRHHLKLMSDILGEDVQLDGLTEKCFSGGKNKYRSAYLKAAGDSLRNFCRKMREAVDSVNPKIRLGACSCMSVWDTDGVDSYELAHIMAGGTKPFVRLIGAPYWGAMKCWDNRIENVVELERMERSWYDGDDIEIFSEGDVHPRPRYKIPAAYLEIFDTALRASGGFDGILKYMLDYTSKNEYERGYIDRHLENDSIYNDIHRIFGEKTACGIRVYEAKNKIEDADFSGVSDPIGYAQNMFFSGASRFLSEISVPTVYEGFGCAGTAFGENARSLPKTAFDKPLILDITAAKILAENGVDVGIDSFGSEFVPATEIFPDGEYVSLCDGGKACTVTAKDTAEALSEYEYGGAEGRNIPAVLRYQNADGNRFVIFNFVSYSCVGTIRRHYRRAVQINCALEAFGEKLPLKCFGNPDLYVICKKSENSMAIGLWNCFEDYCRNTEIELECEYAKAEFIGCTGRLDGRKIVIDKIPAFEFCFVKLDK